MLLDATMDAISEYEVFETFKEKNPEASVTLQNFDAKLDYAKFMKLHLESLRNSIQYWKKMRPKKISNKILSYEEKMIPTSVLQSDLIEDWTFVIGTNCLPYGQILKFKSKIGGILGKERFVKPLDFMME